MTPHSKQLLEIGRSVLAPFVRDLPVACSVITGSSAEGHSDEFSDLDMIIYYTAMPSGEQLGMARDTVAVAPPHWSVGNPADNEFIEAFKGPRGVECQIVHVTVDRWEADIESVLRGDEPGSPLHKAMSGTLVALPVCGERLLRKWQARLQEYPEALRVAMVKHHLKFFPTWALLERMTRRDSNLWMRQAMLDASFNILGILAGVNRKFFTTFQFKRTQQFVDSLTVRPVNLTDRLDALWTGPLPEASMLLKSLVAETVALVEREMPVIDLTSAKKALARQDSAWEFTPQAA